MTFEGRNAKILLAVLAISVIANIFIVSFIAGRMSTQSRRPDAAMRLAYPPPIRIDAEVALRARRGEMAAAVRRLREARAAMAEIARAPTLDRAALESAMADVRAATTAIQQISQDALTEALVEASPEERAAIPRTRERRRPD